MSDHNTTEQVQCEVTGAWLDAEDTVMFRGKRVSAEGKRVLLEQARSGERLPGELEKPRLLQRIGAIILDSIILGIPLAILGFVAAGLFIGSGTGSAALLQLPEIIGAIITIAYFALMHARNGKTLGKMAGKIRVVMLDGSQISSRTAWIRSLAYAGPNLISSVAMLILVVAFGASNLNSPTPAAGSEAFATGAIVLGALVGIYGIANIIVALVNSQQRSIHDMIAGTRVIQVD